MKPNFQLFKKGTGLKTSLFLTGFIFGLFLLVLPNIVEAMCPLTCLECRYNQRSDSLCWGKPDDYCVYSLGAGVERVGTIGNIEEAISDNWGGADTPCYYGDNACANEAFPSDAGYNGQVCKAVDRCAAPACADGWGGSDCIQSGHWDASEFQCVSCDGKKEEWVRGDTTAIYAGCSGVPSGCNAKGIQGENYGKCESACPGVDTQCDEIAVGASCGAGKQCNDSCQCVTACECTSTTVGGCCDGCHYCPAGKVFNGTSCVDATATLKCGSTVNKCTAGQCSGEKRYPECNGAGTCDTSVTTYYTSETVYASAGKVFTSSCTDQDATSQSLACDGNTNYFCTAGNCSGYYRYSECKADHSCDTAATTNYQETSVTASAGKVLSASCTDQDATSTIKCASTVNKCTAPQCSGAKRYPECQSGGICDSSATSYYTSETVYASAGYSLTSSCGTTGSTLCGSSYLASSGPGNNHYGDGGSDSCQGMCDGSGNCDYAVNCVGCSCGAWSNTGCGVSPCSSTQMKQTRTCTPAGCDDVTSQCIADDSCTGAFDFSISVNPTSGSVTQGGSTSPSTVTATLISGTTQSVSFYIGSGLPLDASATFNPSSCNPTCSSSMTISTLATTPVGTYQLTVCGTTGTIIHCYSYYTLTVTEAGAGINPPQVRTDAANPVGTTSTTLNGTLLDMGGATTCLVWFEYKKSTDTVWTKVCETTMYSAVSFPPCNVSGLTSNTNYVFEAFAKNGGSW